MKVSRSPSVLSCFHAVRSAWERMIPTGPAAHCFRGSAAGDNSRERTSRGIMTRLVLQLRYPNGAPCVPSCETARLAVEAFLFLLAGSGIPLPLAEGEC